MPYLNLSRVASSPYFAQAYSVTRQTGSFQLGGYVVNSTTVIPFWGIIQPATDEDLAQVPEGDRVTGMIGFIGEQRMFQTFGGGVGDPSGLSDTITWNNEVYKVVKVVPWRDFAFWKAIASRQSGV
jgi:hypothetical protein